MGISESVEFLNKYIVSKRDIKEFCKNIEKARNIIDKNKLNSLDAEVIQLNVIVDAKFIIKCKRCFQSLRIPVIEKSIIVKCPICKEEMKI